MNTSIQMRKQKTHKAVNKKLYNLRDKANQILERERLKIDKNIIVVFDKKRPLTSPKAKEQPKKIQKSEAERKSELKKINSAISVYENRIDALLSEDEKDELKKRKEQIKALRKQAEKALRSEERKAVKEIIKDEEKSLETVRNGFIQSIPQALTSRVLKMQEKLKELFKKREDFKEAKEVPETRGKKQKIHFVEFEISITMSNEWKENKEFVKTFQDLQTQFLKNKFFAELELELNVIHLDQYSVHSHAMFKLPEGKTFDTHLREVNKDGRIAYEILNRAWHNTVEKELKAKFGIEIEEMQSGKHYISLRDFKKQNPVQILEKEEKINPRANMSEIPTHLKGLVERTKQNREKINSLSKKEKTSEASERSDTSDSEQTESQNNRRKNR